MSGGLNMAGFRTELARNVNLQLGESAFGPFDVDNDVARIGLRLSRENWTDPRQRIDVVIEESIDNGPFKFVASLVATGGPAPDPPRENVTSISVDMSPGKNRRVRGVYTCSGQRIRMTVEVEAKT